MAIGEAQALAGELVEMGSGDFGRAVATEVAIADVIAVDDDHIGLVLGCCREEAEGSCAEEELEQSHGDRRYVGFWPSLSRLEKCPCQESNLDLTFRKRLFYPLNYRGVTSEQR